MVDEHRRFRFAPRFGSSRVPVKARHGSFAVAAILLGLGCGGATGTGTAPRDAVVNGSDATSGEATPEASPAPEVSMATAETLTDDAAPDAPEVAADTADAGAEAPGGLDAPDASIACGSPTTLCSGGNSCCVTPQDGGASFACASPCPVGSASVSCDGPEDCLSMASCCADLAIGPGVLPSCPFLTGIASCRGSCVTSPPLSCPAMARVRLCHTSADCTGEAFFDTCCMYSQGSTTVRICTNKLLATGSVCF